MNVNRVQITTMLKQLNVSLLFSFIFSECEIIAAYIFEHYFIDNLLFSHIMENIIIKMFMVQQNLR